MPGRRPRTPLGRALHAALAGSEQPPTGAGRADRRARAGFSRRDFLKIGAMGTAAMLLPACVRTSQNDQARVVIVGAGLAGLRCAQMLNDFGIDCTVYEASDGPGGRVSTLRGFFDHGQIVERGGELISSEHSVIRRLAADFELELELADGEWLDQYEDVLWVDGSRYSIADANEDWSGAYQSVKRALGNAPWPQTYDSNTEEGRRLDHISVPEWIDSEIAGGMSGRLGKIMYTTVIAEYGGEASDMPALALIYLLGWNSPASLAPLAGTDEAFHIKGGNDQLVNRLRDELPSDTVQYDSPLESVRSLGDGRLQCTFRADTAAVDVVAEHLVLALPFTALRDVDLDDAGLSDLKLKAIREIGMGTNSKLHVQFDTRPWVVTGKNGYVVTNSDSFQMTWDETAAQPGEGPVLDNFTGGDRSLRYPGPLSAQAPPDLVAELLGEIEPIFPGATAQYNGKAWRDWWVASPWQRGSYVYWRLGQSTDFAGIEAEREGNIHFCGEHTSIEYGGYMEGALRSGQRAAVEVRGG